MSIQPIKFCRGLALVAGTGVFLLITAGVRAENETFDVQITGMGVLEPDWSSAIGFELYSPTSDGYDTVTFTNYTVTGAHFTFADASGSTNASPDVEGDASANLTTNSVPASTPYTAADFPDRSTVTGITSFTLTDDAVDSGLDSQFFNTFWVTDSAASTMNFDINITSTGVGSDPDNPDLLYVYLGNCGWPTLQLPTNSPLMPNGPNYDGNGDALIYLPFTSTDPTPQFFTTQPGFQSQNKLYDTNYPGITASLVTTPEPSPMACLAIGAVLLGGAAILRRQRSRRSS